jgi:hypothetical protein
MLDQNIECDGAPPLAVAAAERRRQHQVGADVAVVGGDAGGRIDV